MYNPVGSLVIKQAYYLYLCMQVGRDKHKYLRSVTEIFVKWVLPGHELGKRRRHAIFCHRARTRA